MNDDQIDETLKQEIPLPKALSDALQSERPRKVCDPTQKRKRPPFFLVAQDDEQHWHFVLLAGNGRPLAVSAQLYKRCYDAKTAIRDVVDAIKQDDLKVEIED